MACNRYRRILTLNVNLSSAQLNACLTPEHYTIIELTVPEHCTNKGVS